MKTYIVPETIVKETVINEFLGISTIETTETSGNPDEEVLGKDFDVWDMADE